MHDPTSDTIVAISTPPGRGGIGIVRLSGPQARSISQPMLRLQGELTPAHARFAEVLDLTTGDEQAAVLDEAVVTFFAAPRSYTTEDIVEIAAHGSPILLEHILRQCLDRGARLAEPGEFTQRAFLAGRLDLTQAEAVHDLIEASTVHQARIAARQLGGALARQIRPVKDQLITLIAGLEAGIDFAADDNPDEIDVLPERQITTRIAALRTPLADLAATFPYGRIVREGLSLAIVGRPNAGKSSLFNRLVQRDRAIVTATPGTTRDLVTESVAIDGIPVHLIDTAGLRSTSDEAESIGVGKSREAMAEADVILLVLDATTPLHEEDRSILASSAGRTLLIARNKSDLSPAQFESAAQFLAGHTAIDTSALTGEGLPALRSAIIAQARHGVAAPEGGLLTNLRQHQAVSSAVASLTRATDALGHCVPHEIVLLDLYEALAALDSLTGATSSEAILQQIFSTFCIGK